jgi:hypothetical protein
MSPRYSSTVGQWSHRPALSLIPDEARDQHLGRSPVQENIGQKLPEKCQQGMHRRPLQCSQMPTRYPDKIRMQVPLFLPSTDQRSAESHQKPHGSYTITDADPVSACLILSQQLPKTPLSVCRTNTSEFPKKKTQLACVAYLDNARCPRSGEYEEYGPAWRNVARLSFPGLQSPRRTSKPMWHCLGMILDGALSKLTCKCDFRFPRKKSFSSLLRRTGP